MAMVSGRRSTLNPNATPFIPAAYRQVEDFSSEWWNLVQNSAWFHDYWLSEHQETSFERFSDTIDDDITNLLPDTFDVGYDEFPCLDAEFEDFVRPSETYEKSGFGTEMKTKYGVGLNAGALRKNLNLYSLSSNGRALDAMVEPAKYNERPVQHISSNHGLRRIHQPR